MVGEGCEEAERGGCSALKKKKKEEELEEKRKERVRMDNECRAREQALVRKCEEARKKR